jgi:hypothetical protein
MPSWSPEAGHPRLAETSTESRGRPAFADHDVEGIVLDSNQFSYLSTVT